MIAFRSLLSVAALIFLSFDSVRAAAKAPESSPRERIALTDGWTFKKLDAKEAADGLDYDVRPEVREGRDDGPADAAATEAVRLAAKDRQVLKPWILPTGNRFIKDPAKRHPRPGHAPRATSPILSADFDDRAWQKVTLPHDWAIAGPFLTEGNYGGMGRLPSWGVAWYRRQLDIPQSDAGKRLILEIDGAMSYASVWLNGQLVGGWPYGYNSWQVDLTPYVAFGGKNQLAIRLDNPGQSARWYPGGGLYRKVWLTKTAPVHVAQWGTSITSRDVSAASAVVDVEVNVDNDGAQPATVTLDTELFPLDLAGRPAAQPVAALPSAQLTLGASSSGGVKSSVRLDNPRLWGPRPQQTPHRYVAVTTLTRDGQVVDRYETTFGIRALRFDPNAGIFVNGERIQIKGVNNHHDLGALGAAFNVRAAERQLEILRDMGCNAVRMSHNPPARELLELTDAMGFLVMDEVFDSWERKKTPLDFHLIFPDWYEQDLRAMIRRDRNHPSVIIWSIGNEVGEQYTGAEGGAVAQRLNDIAHDEDPTRPTTSAMNYAKPDMALPAVVDLIGLNYQGEGIRDTPEFEGTERIRTKPMYPAFHEKFPDKVVMSLETASAFSSRGVYLFPVTKETSAPTRDGRGGDSRIAQVSSYELHAVDFGASADKVFGSLERHPFVAGEFVWTGFDYLGEPTPYYSARSSYSGIIDLAGFPKDRYYLYQSHWRPELPLAHLLPHWTWPDRIGQVTPVHVFTSGDEAELFLNGRSLGRKRRGQHEYRLRWDDVIYEPGTLEVVAYRQGRHWATDRVETAGAPARLALHADRISIKADGEDLSFISVDITDARGLPAPRADNAIRFRVEGAGEIVATDNGDPTSFEPFPAPQRKAFSGRALVIVRGVKGRPGTFRLTAESDGLSAAEIVIESR